MGQVSIEQVKQVANVARLGLKEDEVTKFTKQLNDIMKYVEQLDEVDTSSVEPMTHVLNTKNVMREDEVKPSLEREQVFKNAPDHEDGQFKVPSVLE